MIQLNVNTFHVFTMEGWLNNMIKKFKKLLIVTNKPKDVVTLSELYDVYYGWSIDQGNAPLGKINFTRQLDLPKTVLGKNIVGFRGLKLSDDLEWFLDEEL